jgi:rubrerythrin
MKKSIKGTKTEKNLMTAFASESMAVCRYAFFAEAARRQGHEQAAVIFLETAESEKAHAGMCMRLFEGGSIEIKAAWLALPPGDTKDNLAAAVEGESKTWQIRYPEFSKTAREEGFAGIVALFEKMAADEKRHAEEFSRILEAWRKQAR